MFTEKDGVRSPVTSHTLNPVPLAIHDPALPADDGATGPYRLAPPAEAGLANIAATVLNLLGFEAPDDYEPGLLQFGEGPAA
jgi:2,3-bisphosphoglycerate-independent phosphoglycerate mutase